MKPDRSPPRGNVFLVVLAFLTAAVALWTYNTSPSRLWETIVLLTLAAILMSLTSRDVRVFGVRLLRRIEEWTRSRPMR